MSVSTWPSAVGGYPDPPQPSYALGDVGLLQAPVVDDVLPADGSELDALTRSLVRDAVVYGLPVVLQYEHLLHLALDPDHPSYVGFNVLRHEDAPAGPAYTGFKTPNADTLYSSAWVDLTGGPVALDVPAMGARYYTAHFLDLFSNAVNLSTRTLGADGGRVWLATTDWEGEVPEGTRVLRVATPYLWLLLRVFVRDADDLPIGRVFQRLVTLTPVAASPDVAPDAGEGDADDQVLWPVLSAPAEELGAEEFLAVLDHCLRHSPHPAQEDALVHRFAAIGVGGRTAFDCDGWSWSRREALRQGYDDALALVRSVLTRRGIPAGDAGWRTLRSGTYGFNYLHRAATNYQGLGATIREESGPYTTFVDGSGEPLDGGRDYLLRLDPPPPVDAFWSVSAYDVGTRELVANPAERYSVNDHSRGLLVGDDGSVELRLTSRAGADAGPNVLPVPPGRFYLVLRAYLGGEAVLDGSWTPPPVLPLDIPTSSDEETR
ncbi:DUF1254 domain-containing protein [Nocardioides deserti]|uniref:DUF1254 domain-containing protein n=1 Tax=Nocardioides deserti TaxID=1588644 RepID=A0ABR6U6H3_9ACTN|nr:DUF1254 domain-containing protein [Nocardioides deserti]MBC2960034.1 DUF1254 domain-containing protein [Nocardioides deserti]GGO75129.1 hypothetical protein GCM10012276_24730 [Nocardioides deserti]